MSTHMTVDMPCGQLIFSKEWPNHKKKCPKCQTTNEVAEKVMNAPCGLPTPKFQCNWHVTVCKKCIKMKEERSMAVAVRALVGGPATSSTAAHAPLASPVGISKALERQTIPQHSPITRAAASIPGSNSPHQGQDIPNSSDLENRPPHHSEAPRVPTQSATTRSSEVTESEFDKSFAKTKRSFNLSLINRNDIMVFQILLDINGITATDPEEKKTAELTLELFMSHFEGIMLNNKDDDQLATIYRALHTLATSTLGPPVIPVLFKKMNQWLQEKLTTQSLTQAQFGNLHRSLQAMKKYFFEEPIWMQKTVSIDGEQLPIHELVETWGMLAMSLADIEPIQPGSCELDLPSSPASIPQKPKVVRVLRFDDHFLQGPATASAALSVPPEIPKTPFKALIDTGAAAHPPSISPPIEQPPARSYPTAVSSSQHHSGNYSKVSSAAAATLNTGISSALTTPLQPRDDDADLATQLLSIDIAAGIETALQEQDSTQLAFWISYLESHHTPDIRKFTRDKLLECMQQILWQHKEHSLKKLHTFMNALNIFSIKEANNYLLLNPYFRILREQVSSSLQMAASREQITKLRESLESIKIQSQEFFDNIKDVLNGELIDRLLIQLASEKN